MGKGPKAIRILHEVKSPRKQRIQIRLGAVWSGLGETPESECECGNGEERQEGDEHDDITVAGRAEEVGGGEGGEEEEGGARDFVFVGRRRLRRRRRRLSHQAHPLSQERS